MFIDHPLGGLVSGQPRSSAFTETALPFDHKHRKLPPPLPEKKRKKGQALHILSGLEIFIRPIHRGGLEGRQPSKDLDSPDLPKTREKSHIHWVLEVLQVLFPLAPVRGARSIDLSSWSGPIRRRRCAGSVRLGAPVLERSRGDGQRDG